VLKDVVKGVVEARAIEESEEQTFEVVLLDFGLSLKLPA